MIARGRTITLDTSAVALRPIARGRNNTTLLTKSLLSLLVVLRIEDVSASVGPSPFRCGPSFGQLRCASFLLRWQHHNEGRSGCWGFLRRRPAWKWLGQPSTSTLRRRGLWGANTWRAFRSRLATTTRASDGRSRRLSADEACAAPTTDVPCDCGW